MCDEFGRDTLLDDTVAFTPWVCDPEETLTVLLLAAPDVTLLLVTDVVTVAVGVNVCVCAPSFNVSDSVPVNFFSVTVTFDLIEWVCAVFGISTVLVVLAVLCVCAPAATDVVFDVPACPIVPVATTLCV